MCAQWRLKVSWRNFVSLASQNAHCEDSDQTTTVNAQADLNLCWMHMSEGTFSCVMTHPYFSMKPCCKFSLEVPRHTLPVKSVSYMFSWTSEKNSVFFVEKQYKSRKVF